MDIAVFALLSRAGVQLATAHFASFAVAYALFSVVRLRPALLQRPGQGSAVGPLLGVGLFVLFLRGGVVALLLQWGCALPLAFALGAIASFLAVTGGCALVLAAPQWSFGAGPHWRVGLAAIVVAAYSLRLVFNGQVELLPEESYYWNYGEHLDIGYLDHPPMVAWTTRLCTTLLGSSEFAVRLSALCSSVVAAVFVFRLTRNLFGEPAARVAVVLMQILPFFFLGGMLMTPDAPLTAAWAAALYFLERALLGGCGRAWLAAGVCIGIGLISKYTIVLLVPAAALFVLLDPASRRWLFRWEPYAAALIAAVFFAPVLIWNAQHEWASFTFQTVRRLAERPRFSLHKLLLSALVLLTPMGVMTLAYARPALEEVRRWRFLQVCTLVPLSVFIVFSIRHDVKIDWTGALWLAVVPALAVAIIRFASDTTERMRRRLHRVWVPTAMVMLLVYAGLLHYLVLGLPAVGYSTQMELVPVGWRDLGRQVDALADEMRRTGHDPLIVGMDRYELASQLTFYGRSRSPSQRGPASAHLFGRTALMYERWYPPAEQRGRDLLLVGWSPADMPDDLIAPLVRRLGPIREGVLKRDATVIRHFYFRSAYGYEPRGAP